ncbi:MAG TPA: hypothetical protein VJK52_00085 [Candidatus Nanoarchaeia archaeon]|nr:hypothetical protein [Candidatus Nanoarchaeia archaeon]
MFGKRGQQFAIGIVAVVIFVGLVGILYQVDRTLREARTVRSVIDESGFSLHLQTCLENTIAEAATILARQGGFAQLPANRIGEGMPLLDSDEQVPNTEAIRASLTAAVEHLLPDCVETYGGSSEISAGKPTARLSFSADTIDAEIDYPITLTSDSAQQEFTEWTATISHGLPATAAAAEEYLRIPKPYIRLQPLVDAAGHQAVEVRLTDLGNSVVQYEFEHAKTVFRFAVQYDWSTIDTSFGGIARIPAAQINALDIPVTVSGNFYYGELGNVLAIEQGQGNHPPVIPEYTTQRVVVGRTLLIPLRVTDPDGDPLTYEVLTPLPGLEIKSNGMLQWGPTNYQDVTIRFRVSDGTESREGSIRIIAGYAKVDWEKLSYP